MRRRAITPISAQTFVEKFKTNKLSTTATIVCYTLAILILAGVGVLFQNATFGNILILIFGIIAVVAYVKGVEILKMMIVTLICAMFLTVTKNFTLANVFAQYSFLFLVIAMINILREEWKLRSKTVDK